ncbi:unnamed protein product [Cuscuta campestris]|uniref:Uncharacterized protein n=1 Tax=Cuscuta campestris TaxID=132261 RepID=A0A484KR05_9ASTE|nr:unnamed protein product [Cuscuta campestris]
MMTVTTTSSPPSPSLLSFSCSTEHKFFPLSVSFHSRARLSRKPVLISITTSNHKFPKSIFCIFNSINKVSSVDDAPKTNPSLFEVKTSLWKWRGYSIRYQYAGSIGPALVLLHGFGANRSRMLLVNYLI